MRRIVLSIAMFCTVLYSCKEAKARDSEDVEVVSVEEMEAMIKYEETDVIGEKGVQEYEKDYLKDAQYIVYGNSSQFKERLSNLDPKKSIAVHYKDIEHKTQCSKILRENGFVKILEVKGGIFLWVHKEDEVSN